MTRIPSLLLVGVLLGSSPPLRSEPSADPEGGAAAEFIAMRAGFGLMETVAGRVNSIDDCEDWLPSYENGDATLCDLSRPHMAAADAEGNVYIADKEGYTIRKVTLDGKIHTVAGSGVRGISTGDEVATSINLREPNGVYVFPDGCFYLLEVTSLCDEAPGNGGTIRKVDTDGMMTTVVDDPGLQFGRGLWVSEDESVIFYCSGTVVKRWTEAGGIEVFASGFAQLGNLDVAPDGSVFVTDRFAHRVYRLSPDGSERSVVAGTGFTSGGAAGDGVAATSKALNEVRGIALRPDGSFLVCTHRHGQVWFVDTAGLIWMLINGNSSKSTHDGDGEPLTTLKLKISEPRAITIAPNGDLIITENDRGFVRRVTNTCVTPAITTFARQGNAVGLIWQSHRQASYVIEQSQNLSDWLPVGEPEAGGAGSTTSAVVPTSNDADFFRVRETE